MEEYQKLSLGDEVYQTNTTVKYDNRKKYSAPNEKFILATIPGTICTLFVKEASSVKKGERLLILEAMKMNNIISSHRNATIKRILVKEGDKIAKNTVLIELE